MNRAVLRGTWISAGLLIVALGQQDCFAQFSGRANIGRQTSNYLYNRPTVSPYLNLTTRESSSGLPNYFTMVRPQLDRQEQDRDQQRQNAQVQQQLGRVQNQIRETQQMQAGMMLTGRVGWSSRGMPRFGSYLNFYPGMYRRR